MNLPFVRMFAICVLALISLFTLSCTRSQPKPRAKEPPTRPSDIQVEVKSGGPLVLTTTTSVFEVAPSGYVQAFLLRDGKRLTLDDPKLGAPNESDYFVQNGADVHFILDFDQTKVLESIGKLGRGKHVEIPDDPARIHVDGTGTPIHGVTPALMCWEASSRGDYIAGLTDADHAELRGYAIELDPGHVDTAIARWQRMTRRSVSTLYGGVTPTRSSPAASTSRRARHG